MTAPFPTADAASPDDAVVRPAVAAPPGRGRGLIGYGLVGLMGVATFAAMAAHRGRGAETPLIPATEASAARFTTPVPLPAGAAAAGSPGGVPVVPAPQFTVDNGIDPAAPQTALMPGFAPGPAVGTIANPASTGGAMAGTRLSSPAMILDLSDAATGPGAAGALPANPALPVASAPMTGGSGAGSAGADAGSYLGNPAEASVRATATRMGRTDAVVAEGTVLTATLETAINSDLPGLARAVIARNVMSFDGTRVLIPRGSRVVGQYRSGVALGASRVFIIWTRLIRPDGVSIQLQSPGGDDLGRGGLPGKVDRHFFQRFGGSILATVLNGAVTLGSAAVGRGAPVYISTMADATTAATSAVRSTDIPPTIRTPPGISMKIFVARDLDFSGLDAGR